VSAVARVVAIGERARVAGFALAGADVVVAEDEAAVRAAVAALSPDQDVAVLLLTPRAREALRPVEAESGADLAADVAPGRPLVVVMPR
jgi:vacuolar-type H+-ATPase subunit F/Vma7